MAESEARPRAQMSSINASGTIFGSLAQSAGQMTSSRALVGLRNADEWVELSYDEVLTDAVAASARLAALGVRRGDVVCILLPNWTEAAIYTYAAARLGAVVCPITTIYRQRELRFILERTECKVLIIPSVYRGFDYAAMVDGIREELAQLRHIICVGESSVANVISSRTLLGEEAGEDEIPAAVDEPDALAVLAFTSGTTGEPKGVMHSHASMQAAMDGFVDHAGFGPGRTSLVMSPFGHLTGFTWGVLMPIRSMGTIVMLDLWDAKRALELTTDYSVELTVGATPFLSDMLDAAEGPSSSLPEVFVCAGAPIPPVLVEEALRRHSSRVLSAWGMSEYPIGTSTSIDDSSDQAIKSDGRPCGKAEILVVDAHGTPVPVGEEGDLLIRGPGLFKGYYKRPDLDADHITADGFLKTGDRARLLDDESFIRISGRTKDIIIRGGENIPVLEIENLILTHPGIKEVALVPIPHERLGETACACVVIKPGHQAPTVAELGEFLDAHGVAKQFFPEAVEALPELPRTASGKIQKYVLRDRFTPPKERGQSND
jgi:cyclohexanecarboxylate-CoA ligase